MKMTHEGLIEYNGRTTVVKLRETDSYWITEEGVRYRKRRGYPTGNRFPCEVLKVDSVKRV